LRDASSSAHRTQERRAAPERKRIAQVLTRKYLNERAADDEVPLDLKILDPRGFPPPFRNMVTRDHSSASTFVALHLRIHRDFVS
jgi:hypothetical protein